MTYDVIVLGCGGVGSAAVYHLARRGVRVLGIDQFPGGHDRGSSHGHTRVIRQAYFEHPDYVPLLRRAYPLWLELENEVQKKLFHRVGLLEIGPADGIVVPGVLAAAQQHELAVQQLTHNEAVREFPAFTIPEDCVAVFEQDAGYLLVEQCVLAHLSAAEKAGATLRNEVVQAWQGNNGDVTVTTSQQTYHAGNLVMAAGPWSAELLREVDLSLRVLRKHLHWFQNDDPRYQQGCPTYLYELPHGIFYGFPQVDDRGIKVGEHTGGTPIVDLANETRRREPADWRRVAGFTKQHLPGVSETATNHAVCFYTMTADQHFIVDRHPRYPQVAFAAGLSGHGFKFTGVLGQALADLALEGQTSLPIDFLRSMRDSLRLPNEN